MSFEIADNPLLTIGLTSAEITQLANIDLSVLTASEWAQLANINLHTISNTKWGYLASLDQSVSTSSNVILNSLTTKDITLSGGSNVIAADAGSIVLGSAVSISDVTDSTSVTTGSLILSGGLAVPKSIWSRDYNVKDGTMKIEATGGHGLITGESGASGQLILRSTTHATKGTIVLDESTESSSISTGTLTTSGGIGVTKRITVGDGVSAQKTFLGSHQSSWTGAGSLLGIDGTSTVNAGGYAADLITVYGGINNGTSGLDTSFMNLWGSTSINSTCTRVASLEIHEPSIVKAGGASITTTATLYIADAATEGTNNYAILVDAGETRLKDVVKIGSSNIVTISSTGTVNVPNTTPSTSSTTGAMVVSGGLGVGGDVFCAGLGLFAQQGACYQRTSTQTMTGASTTIIVMNSSLWSRGSITLGADFIGCTIGGLYMITLHTAWGGTTSSTDVGQHISTFTSGEIALYNGAIFANIKSHGHTPGISNRLSSSCILSMPAGGRIRMYGYNEDASDQTIGGETPNVTSVQIILLSTGI